MLILFAVDDTSKEQYSTSINKQSFSLTVKDRLSELPNDLWPYILSLLSVRDVARLAILSRNLRNVCLLSPCLDLDCRVMFGMPKDFLHSKECEPYKAAYVKIVDQFLQNYRDQNIFSLRLACCLDNNHTDDVDRWISIAAANKHMQDLCLRFSCCCIVKVENDVKLSKLTILDLTDVILEGTKWQGFLASSSTIKCLYLRLCNLPNKLCIGDNFPQLSFLKIGFCYKLQELELSARNLTTFEFQSFHDVECSFFNVPRLENVGTYMATPAYRKFCLNLAANASSLKYVFLHRADFLSGILPPPKGRCLMPALSLHMSMCGVGVTVKVLPQLLNFFPFLRRLEIELPRESYGDKYKLPCFHENLKEVRLFGFRVEWIPVATFFLQSARVLDRIVLTVSRDTSWGYESQCFTEDMLQGCQRCKVYVLSKKECNHIQKALKGKAISATAQVIIENLH